MGTRGGFRSGLRSICAQPAYSGVRDVLTNVYKEGGIRALYRGIGVFMLLLLCLTMHCGVYPFVAGVDEGWAAWLTVTALLVQAFLGQNMRPKYFLRRALDLTKPVTITIK